jgi:hypothetical protein
MGVEVEDFGRMPDGASIRRHTLRNGNGVVAKLKAPRTTLGPPTSSRSPPYCAFPLK